MPCPDCNAETTPGARFCIECGCRLAARCAECGTDAPPGAKFCPGCGTRLRAEAQAGAEAAIEPWVPEPPAAEKRNLAVLFCDLVGSTELSQQLDPEDLREVMEEYQQRGSAIVERFGGHVAQLLGDGLLVYFGYPQALENASELAVRAGLAVTNAIREMRGDLDARYGVTLEVRIGIHWGSALVGGLGGPQRGETLATGETLNIASRLQDLAPPGEVVVSEETLHLIPGLFMVRALGPKRLKGVARSIHVFSILRPIGVRSGLDLAAADSEFVGRGTELDMLLERWEVAKNGRGSVVLLSGEAGIGKSRLARELRRRLADQPLTWLETRSSSYDRNRPLQPIVELMRNAIGYRESDSVEQQLHRLEAALSNAEFDLAETVPFMAELHGVPTGDHYPRATLTPDAVRRRTLEICCEWLIRMARQQPTVLLVEDVHWSDPTTLELLSTVLDQAPTANFLAIYTFRPEFESPWPAREHVSTLLLQPLAAKDAARLAWLSASDDTVTPEAIESVVGHADGNPLFIEELSKVVRSRGAQPSREVPSSLQDSLMARLDRLGRTRELAQVGAAIGREFGFDLLRALWREPDADLERSLKQLVAAEIIYQRGQPPGSTYIFKHALIQDVAYDSLLRKDVKAIHRRIADTLENEFPTVAEENPDLLARHFDAADQVERAVAYYGTAAQRAQSASAHTEAIRMIEEALSRLDAIPDQQEREKLELGLQMQLNVSLIPTNGYAAPQVAACSLRAGELARSLGTTAQSFVALWGLWLFHLVRADRSESYQIVDQLFEMAEESDDDGMLLQAHSAAILTHFYAAEYDKVIEHYAAGMKCWDPERHAHHALVYGDDPVAYMWIYHGLSQWMLGRPDLALSECEQGFRRAEEVDHPFTVAGALAFMAQVHFLRREPDAVKGYADRTLHYSQEQNFPLFLANGMLYQAFPTAQRGDLKAALEQVHPALGLYRLTGARLNEAFYGCHLAPLYLKTGQFKECLEVVEQGIEHAAAHLDRYFEPELHRLRGELLLASGDEGGAERAFHSAIDVARAQSALSLELRATTDLARLLASQGKPLPGRDLLASVYEGFEEGFETADLRDARSLLDALSA